jgi:cytochrome c biogenesis protein ResB
MKKLILLLLVLSLSACVQPRGITTYHPAVNKKGHKANRTLQEKTAASFGRNMKGPNGFKRCHF